MSDRDLNRLGQLCAAGECHAGVIGSEQVRERDWHQSVQRFEGKIELWNQLTKRHAIPHIGFIQPFKFCTECGKAIDHSALSPAQVMAELGLALVSEASGKAKPETLAILAEAMESEITPARAISALAKALMNEVGSEVSPRSLGAIAKASIWFEGPSYAPLFQSLGEKEVVPAGAGLEGSA